jgi:hypothetical protein
MQGIIIVLQLLDLTCGEPCQGKGSAAMMCQVMLDAGFSRQAYCGSYLYELVMLTPITMITAEDGQPVAILFS